MITEPLVIDGLAGSVVVNTNMFSGKSTVTVGGVPAQSTGRSLFELPTADGGTVSAKVRGAKMFDPYPVIEINGSKHRTGPASPLWMTVVSLLPVVLVVGGAVGAIIGVLAVFSNLAVARSGLSTIVKLFLMIGILVVAVLAYLVFAVALTAATT